MKKLQFLLLPFLLLSLSFAGQKHGPKGTFQRMIEEEPVSLNPITSSDIFAMQINSHVLDSLLVRDEDTQEWRAALAYKWKISKDGRTFTFYLRPGVKWHDGKPLSADDVKYSLDVVFGNRFKALHRKAYLETISEAKIVAPGTIQFTAKDTYFKNFDKVAELQIIPRHFYEQGDANAPKFSHELIGTGPYRLAHWEKGQPIILKRNPDYWGSKDPYHGNRAWFEQILFRTVRDQSVAVELLKKGEIDFLDVSNNPDLFMQLTSGKELGANVIAVKTENRRPQNFSYNYLGWNEKSPLFKSRNARLAMSHLINRNLLIRNFLHYMSEEATGPFGNGSPASSPKVRPIPYDPKLALQLLEKEGWHLREKGLVRTIAGKEERFEFTVLTANPNYEKYLTLISEDMKKTGITMHIKRPDWTLMMKLLDERNFDVICLGWQINDFEPDPKVVWHSSSIPAPGYNFVSYANPELDRLIDKLRLTTDPSRRKTFYHQIHELIAEDQPYSFFFNTKSVLYFHSSRIAKQSDTLRFAIGERTWRIKE